MVIFHRINIIKNELENMFILMTNKMFKSSSYSSVSLLIKLCLLDVKMIFLTVNFQEHYHGLIRGMSKGVDTLQNTLNCISKSNIIQDIQNQFQLNFRKKTRFSVGGVNFDNNKTDYIECNIDFSPQEIINQLEQLSVYGKGHNIDELFIPKLIFYSDEIGKSSLRIISREITNHQELKYDNKLKNIEEEDDYEEDDADFRKDLELIDQLLNEEEDIEEDYDWNEEEEEEEYNEE